MQAIIYAFVAATVCGSVAAQENATCGSKCEYNWGCHLADSCNFCVEGLCSNPPQPHPAHNVTCGGACTPGNGDCGGFCYECLVVPGRGTVCMPSPG